MLVSAALALWLAAVPLLAYPAFGIKRYGRSSGVSAGAVAAPGAAAGAWPRAYYGDYHYTQQPQPPLAYAYPPLPYYYDQPRQHPGYGFYNYDDDVVASDPIEDIEAMLWWQDEIQQEAEREQREEALPIGQEMWFEHSSPRDDTAEVNSQFLRNLILSQLYSDEQQRQRAAAAASLYPHAQPPQLYLHPQVQQQVPYGVPLLPEHEERLLADDAAAWEYTSSARQLPYPYGTEEDAEPAAYDEDVVELKSLVKKARQHAASASLATQKRPEFASELGPWFEGGMRFSDRKAPAGDESQAAAATSTSTPAPDTTTTTSTTTARPAFDDKRRGMKEVAMPRPATPVRRPTGTRSGSGSHTSVYDTIRHLLSMEATLQEKEEVSRRPPQKRFVSSEEALVEQLGGLHKPLST
ncbi:uncharacterized protein LOC126278381 isoform X1 [Schistocerca gregaria]|uniref:uncharacterized protein LOC126278381 isoform X1 n=1 Tax=Schistocerca gregaria TaxID=7010 RepID=UPI00211F3510|nr:uncharacterized protein LOC126278381 isoform X1 [Schistocerca gregaria]